MKDAREELRGIIAQGYCTDRNSKKVLDPDLIEDIADAILSAGFIRLEVK